MLKSCYKIFYNFSFYSNQHLKMLKIWFLSTHTQDTHTHKHTHTHTYIYIYIYIYIYTHTHTHTLKRKTGHVDCKETPQGLNHFYPLLNQTKTRETKEFYVCKHAPARARWLQTLNEDESFRWAVRLFY
jgi:hypothetical protein